MVINLYIETKHLCLTLEMKHVQLLISIKYTRIKLLSIKRVIALYSLELLATGQKPET